MKIPLFIIFVFVFLLLGSGIVLAEPIIQQEVYEELEKNDEVQIIVELHDSSGLSINPRLTKEGKTSLINQKKQLFSQVQSEVLTKLSEKFKVKHQYNTVNGFSGRINKEGLKILLQDQRVKAIFYDKPKSIHAILDQSVPLINGNVVQNMGYTGIGQTVCVIDSGINYSHSALGGCFGSGCKVLSGYDFVNSDSNPMDDAGHGTHVAGIVASNDGTYKGVAPDAKLLALKVLDQNGDGTPSDLVAAIDWCNYNSTIYNISVITISIGDSGEYTDSNCPSTGKTSIDTAVSLGVFVSIASGNEGYTTGINWPGCIRNATSVGSTTKSDAVSSFSNRYSALDLLAPGGSITSLRWNPQGDNPFCLESGDFMTCSGTSMATPHVAGAAALLQDAYNGAPIPQQILWALNSSGKKVWDPKVKTGFFPWQNGMYFPRIDVEQALVYLSYLDILNIDWPTENHDFRRTGFTLLKGDMDDQSDISKIDFVMEPGAITAQEQVVKAIVADIDGNGDMETVSFVHRNTISNQTRIYAVGIEKKRNLYGFGYKYPTTKRWSTTAIGGAIYFPATLANIDLDGNNEVIFADVVDNDSNWPGEVYDYLGGRNL